MNQSKLTNEQVLSDIAEGWVGQADNGTWWRAGFVEMSPIYLRRVESLLTSGRARFSETWLDGRDGHIRLVETVEQRAA